MTDFEIENVPKELYKEITELAKTNNRTTSEEVISLLKKALNLNKANRKRLLKKIKTETDKEQNKEKSIENLKEKVEYSEIKQSITKAKETDKTYTEKEMRENLNL